MVGLGNHLARKSFRQVGYPNKSLIFEWCLSFRCFRLFYVGTQQIAELFEECFVFSIRSLHDECLSCLRAGAYIAAKAGLQSGIVAR